MITTSVSGHLFNLEFDKAFKSWYDVDPVALFDAPVRKYCPDAYLKIKKTLEREAYKCQILIIWTDCDREGENIGSEIVEVCMAVNPNIKVFRAKFSEITSNAVHHALNNLTTLNENVSKAVDVRQQLDLRIGAAFTRFQTLRLQKNLPQLISNQLISYGSCQIPTLGFVVERYKQAKEFIPQYFWKIQVFHNVDDVNVEFLWKRTRLFDEACSKAVHALCMHNPEATVKSVDGKQKTKWRPLPMDTIELEKLSSRKLKINAKETMKIAEKLYTKGYISYPRTETNIFPKDFNLSQYVQFQISDPNWGFFAQKIMDNGGPRPRAGKKSDQAHPPIHPTKHATDLGGDERRVYELVVRHFLACVSADAVGFETTAEITIASEEFKATGLCVMEKNYLEVYPYDKWNSKPIHHYENGDKFTPTNIDLVPGQTSAPALLTEADLIALMDRHGIGTDATHAEHIATIKDRQYVGEDGGYLLPGVLGMGLVEGYINAGLELSKPHYRANLEQDLKLACDGLKDHQALLTEQINIYRDLFSKICAKADELDKSIVTHYEEARSTGGAAPPRTPYRDPGLPPPTHIEFRPPQPPRPPGGPGNDRRGPGNDRGNGSAGGSWGNKRPDGGDDEGKPGYRPTWTSSKRDAVSHAGSKEAVAMGSDDDDFFKNIGDDMDLVVKCSGCGEPARKLTVAKEGVNKGRTFYVCPKPREQQCKFFEWADEPAQPTFIRHSPEATRGRGRANSRGGSSGSRGRGNAKKSNAASRATTSGTKRKCSHCQQVGHTKNKCPNISYV